MVRLGGNLWHSGQHVMAGPPRYWIQPVPDDDGVSALAAREGAKDQQVNTSEWRSFANFVMVRCVSGTAANLFPGGGHVFFFLAGGDQLWRLLAGSCRPRRKKHTSHIDALDLQLQHVRVPVGCDASHELRAPTRYAMLPCRAIPYNNRHRTKPYPATLSRTRNAVAVRICMQHVEHPRQAQRADSDRPLEEGTMGPMLCAC